MCYISTNININMVVHGRRNGDYTDTHGPRLYSIGILVPSTQAYINRDQVGTVWDARLEFTI